MEIGKCYQITRITGKVVRFKLIAYTNTDNRIGMEQHNAGGSLWLDKLTPDEFASVKQIDCEGNDN